MEKQSIILVPEQWLKSLLEDAVEAENEMKNWESKDFKMSKIRFKVSALIGYAKSSETILKHNERVEQ